MRLIAKTMNGVILEVTNKEMMDNGFDGVWDSIREKYPESEYETEDIANDDFNVIIKLKKRDVFGYLFEKKKK